MSPTRRPTTPPGDPPDHPPPADRSDPTPPPAHRRPTPPPADRSNPAPPPADGRPTPPPADGRPTPPPADRSNPAAPPTDGSNPAPPSARASRRSGARSASSSAAYRRSAGSPRGEARRRELLDRVADDLAANGLVDFSLRRAARAAGTTHKVLLYYFDGPDDLLTQAILKLRDRRIDRGLAAAARDPDRPLSARVRDLWPALVVEEGHVLDQAIGLSMYDPGRYAALGQGASQHYLPALLSLLPGTWTERRRLEVAELILGALRGFLIDRLTSGSNDGVDAGLDALSRALDREEAVDSM